MSNNNSDYERKYLDLFQQLPEVYKSDTNKSLFSNLFNRFLTKQEIHKVTGYVGHGNPAAIVSRQIQEPTVHRQAFQLQPVVKTKIGSIEHMASWKDFENELTRLGVNLDCTDIWNKVVQFNWVPPIDIDKVIHFQDYYWYDIDNQIFTLCIIVDFHRGLYFDYYTKSMNKCQKGSFFHKLIFSRTPVILYKNLPSRTFFRQG